MHIVTCVFVLEKVPSNKTTDVFGIKCKENRDPFALTFSTCKVDNKY